MVVGMALDVEGRPICCEMWPGNTADVKMLTPIVKRMRERFRLREITVVADRGMVSQATLEAFERSDPPVRYIVGVRMRRQKEVNTSVLGSRARWFESVPERNNAKDPAPLKVKEVWVKERRYIVCLNEEERRKDAHDREAIVAHLKQQLHSGDKSLVGNKGYRRYLRVEGSGHFVIDEKQVKAEERYDGIWVLRTNTVYNAETVAHVYKALWTVEDIIRTSKYLPQARCDHSRPCILQFPGLSAQARIGEPHETNRSRMGMERGHSRAGWLAASRSQFPGQTFSISQPAYRACFASGPGHGRGDTAYFARTPVIASRRKM